LLCAFKAFWGAVYLLKAQRREWGLLLLVLGIGFLPNMIFVASSRTVFVCIPVLFVIFAFRHFSTRGFILLIAGIVAVGAIAWSSSSIYMRAGMIGSEYQRYQESTAVTSVGERLEFKASRSGLLRKPPCGAWNGIK
jgi:hypothetical protein